MEVAATRADPTVHMPVLGTFALIIGVLASLSTARWIMYAEGSFRMIATAGSRQEIEDVVLGVRGCSARFEHECHPSVRAVLPCLP